MTKTKNSQDMDAELSFTGERFVPDLIEKSIVAEHFQRYKAVLDIVKGKKVLDAACGSGYGTALMATAAKSVAGIDISAEAISYASKRYAKLSNVRYIEASIAELPFEEHSFDVIVSFETIEHVNEELQNSFLQEIKRCLKKDGILIMSSPDRRTYSDLPKFNNEFHVKEFYFNEFKDFLRQEFKHCKYYLQGEQNISGEIIHSADGQSTNLKILNDMDYHIDNDLYVIAICSNQPIDFAGYDISSVFCYEYVPTAYRFVDNDYVAENIVYPSYFAKGKICTVKFDLSSCKTNGRIRFDPLENACCTVDMLKIATDAKDAKIASLNHVKKDGNTYTFINIDPIIEITGDFSHATYLEIQYRLSILDTRTVAILADEVFIAKQQELNAKQQELNAKQQELNAKQQELNAKQADLATVRQQKDELLELIDLITNARGYKALEKLRAIKRKITGGTR